MEKHSENNDIRWTKYKIVVPTEQDKTDLIEAFEHIHYSDIDTNNVPVNQLAHEYVAFKNIVVDAHLYSKICNRGTFRQI